MPATPHGIDGSRHKSHKDFNKILAKANQETEAAQKQYFDTLADVDARQKFFSALTTPNSSDHSEIASVKSRIAQLIQQEIDEMGFKDQLSAEEKTALESDTYAEVATKSNYYFSLDEAKLKKNLRVYDFEAPGNKYRHPNVILPHEHCDIQHYIDTRELTEDKLLEIYAYYSLMIDMHIA